MIFTLFFIFTKTADCNIAPKVAFDKSTSKKSYSKDKEEASSDKYVLNHQNDISSCDENICCSAIIPTVVRKLKSVKFDNTYYAFFIPTSAEYREEKLNELIWWSIEETQLFKRSALHQLKYVIRSGLAKNYNEAIALLYQTDYLVENSVEIEKSIISLNKKSLCNIVACPDITYADSICEFVVDNLLMICRR
jgi:hypothetical protein